MYSSAKHGRIETIPGTIPVRMAGINLSQPVLSGSASYQADNWASASASGKLDLLASAQLRRGINVGIGAEALVQLSASVRKFLAVDVNAEARAAARVQAQVQVPLDLFGEAGLAIRLQAIAEAAVAIRLGIGLNTGDFLQLASQEPRLRGAPMRLLELFFEEAVIAAGVQAKAAVSAMAYANLLVTGSLVGSNPGFIVAAEAGLGLKAGAGFQVFFKAGLNSPQRFMRRATDIAVDETLRLIGEQLGEDQRSMLSELRAPVKIALRAVYEFGAALAENGGSFNAAAGPQLAQRICTVVLEEGQRYILESVSSAAIAMFHKLLAEAGISSSQWNSSATERQNLADKLRNMPTDPFEPTQANKDYWSSVATLSVQLIAQLGLSGNTKLTEQAAQVWAAVQLLFRCTERVSSAQIRGSLIGMAANTQKIPFDQAPLAPPPSAIKNHILTALSLPQSTSLNEAHLVEFLIRDAVLQPLMVDSPHVKQVFDIVFGQAGGGGAQSIRVVLKNVGTFVNGSGGSLDSQATLDALISGLQSYLATRLRNDLAPVLRNALTGQPELQLYLDEVLFPVLTFSTEVLADRVRDWSHQGAVDQTSLREACSGILLKLVGRSLVVTMDVLLNTTLEQIRRELNSAAAHVNDNNGIAHKLSAVTSLNRAVVADLLEETLLVCAETFAPLEPERRRRIRGLLFDLLDVVPNTNGGDFVDELKDQFFVPNIEAAIQLVEECGGMIAENWERFIRALFNHLARAALQAIQQILDDAEALIRSWITALEDLGRALLDTIAALTQQIQLLLEAAEDAWNDAYDSLESVCRLIGGTNSRSQTRAAVKSLVVDNALGALEGNDVYWALPKEVRSFARSVLRDTVHIILNAELFDDLWAVMPEVAAGVADLMEDIRHLDLSANLSGQIGDLILDRVEDLVYDQFSGMNIKIPLSFRVGFSLDTPFGTVSYSEEIDLGNVTIKLNPLLRAMRDALKGVSAFEGQIRAIADAVAAAIEKSVEARDTEHEKADAVAERERVVAELESSQRGGFDIDILSPTAGGFYEGTTVEIEVLLTNVPMSYLGLGACEEQRVKMFLNDVERDLSAFVVEERSAQETIKGGPAVVGGKGVGIGWSLSPTQGDGIRRGAFALRYQPGMQVGSWGGTLVVDPEPTESVRDRLGRFRSSQHKPVAPPRGAPERAVDTARARKSGERAPAAESCCSCCGSRKTPVPEIALRAGAARNDKLAGRGKGTANDLAGTRIGRTLPDRVRIDRLEQLQEGLLLRLLVPASECVEGPNTLSVSILSGRSARLESSVCFAVYPATGSAGLVIPTRGAIGGQPIWPTSVAAFAPVKRGAGQAGSKPAKTKYAELAGKKAAGRKSVIEAQAKRHRQTRDAVVGRLEVARARTEEIQIAMKVQQPASEKSKPTDTA